MWHILIPLLLDTCAGGQTYTVQFLDYQTHDTVEICRQRFSPEIQNLIKADIVCGAPLLVDLSDKAHTISRFLFESDTCCYLSQNGVPTRAALFKIKHHDFEYCITPRALKQWKKAKETNHNFLLFAYDEQLVIHRVICITPDSSLGLAPPSYEPFEKTIKLQSTRTLLTNTDTLRTIIQHIYSKDCCVNGGANDCIPFRSVTRGCDERALMVAQYLDPLPYQYVILKINGDCSSPQIFGTVSNLCHDMYWDHHTVAAIPYDNTQNNYYILDPTSISSASLSIDSFKYENWIKKIRPAHNCSELKKTTYYPPYFCSHTDCLIVRDDILRREQSEGIGVIRRTRLCPCIDNKLDYTY